VKVGRIKFSFFPTVFGPPFASVLPPKKLWGRLGDSSIGAKINTESQLLPVSSKGLLPLECRVPVMRIANVNVVLVALMLRSSYDQPWVVQRFAKEIKVLSHMNMTCHNGHKTLLQPDMEAFLQLSDRRMLGPLSEYSKAIGNEYWLHRGWLPALICPGFAMMNKMCPDDILLAEYWIASQQEPVKQDLLENKGEICTSLSVTINGRVVTRGFIPVETLEYGERDKEQELQVTSLAEVSFDSHRVLKM